MNNILPMILLILCIFSFVVSIVLLSAIFILRYWFDFKYSSKTIIILIVLCALFFIISILLLIYIIIRKYKIDPVEAAYIYRMSSPMSSRRDEDYNDPEQGKYDKLRKDIYKLEIKLGNMNVKLNDLYLPMRNNPENIKIQRKYKELEDEIDILTEKLNKEKETYNNLGKDIHNRYMQYLKNKN